MKTAKFIQNVTVIDPDSGAPVDISIFKDEGSSGMFGVDASYVLFQMDCSETPCVVIEPFNDTEVILCL